jgi:MYXO-CTERM domain-containing protein
VDQDGVPDDCERTYDLDPSDPGDAELDNDLDGINNRDECLNGGDPTVYNGPTAPSLSRPEVGARVADRTPELAVVNATDPDGDALVYTFEVYADAALTQLVAVSPSVTQGEAVTAWEVPFPLTEDATFWWRAQAADDFVGSAWSDTGSFFVDEVNSAPEVPVQVSPMGAVDTTTPALVVDMALDPEGDAVTYLFEVYADEALTELVASGADTETTWTVDAELGEDSTYWWRVAAQDDFEPVAQSDWSDPWSFVVNTANGLPEAPAILSPEEGQVFIDQAEVTLRWSQSSDPEGDALTYDVDLATDVDFIQIVLSEVGVEAGDEQEVELLLEGLELGSSYWARVRAQDGQGAGDFAQVSFSVESSNVAPTAPALLSPAQGDRVQIGDVDFTFSLSTDADGDALTYQVHVYADEAQAEPVASSPLLEELEGPEATQTLTVDVEPGTYYWTVVATDPSGLQAVGGPVAFDMVVTTNEAPGAPTPVSPVGGASVLPGEVVLVVENAVDPDEGDTLEYTFALFSDEALTTQVGEAITQPEGAQGQTSATVADLPEGSYYWIASATDDQGAQGPTSAVSNFVVEAETGGNNGVNNDTNNGGNNDVNNGGNNGGNNDQIPDVDGSVSGGGGGCDCSVPSSPARTPSWPVALLATLLGAFWLRRR